MSNKETKVFTFNENNQTIRVDAEGDNLWFVAKDVCQALGIGWRGDTLAYIPDEWKGMRKFRTPGGEQQLTVISEAGMYKLAFRCQSSERADKFTNWVAGKVLPTLRKTGRYELCPPSPRRSVRKTRGEGVNVELTNLLWLIGESLVHGDQAAVALELGV
ncbi:Bro-N domain-containing protein, partial [Prevotella sp. OH937_COT-195]|uniref:BRO-N domain-containing protein n=1 Tax=Prevotella sp. OH937_COT-195 TaxID=2491051 RepID=UPI000FABAFBD